jgi:hypothetical protein
LGARRRGERVSGGSKSDKLMAGKINVVFVVILAHALDKEVVPELELFVGKMPRLYYYLRRASELPVRKHFCKT